MRQRGAYGATLARCFGLPRAPTLVSRALHDSTMAVTYIDCDIENNGLTRPLPQEDALLVTLQLRDCPKHELWIDGKRVPTAFLPAGTTCVYDLRSGPRANSISPFRQVHFYFPRGALLLATDDDMPMDFTWHNAGIGMDDAAIRGLGDALLPAFADPQNATPLYIDHVTTAAAAHIACLFGNGGRVATVAGMLSARQEQRAKELLRSRPDGSLSIAQLACECGPSPGAFSAAFRKTTGTEPHRWLAAQRVDMARALLGTSLSLASIAAKCGFASADHLTRVFLRLTGRAPRG